MNFTLSPQMKIVALVGGLAALALGGVSMLMARSQKFSNTPVSKSELKHVRPAQHAPAVKPTVVHHTAPARAKHATASHHSVAPTKHPRVTAPAKPKPAHVKHVAVPAVGANGLPTALNVLLHRHSVVVVSLYDPEVEADGIALAEARAGAMDARAGFLAVNVLDGRVAGPLTALAGQGTVLPSPGILIYRDPGTLMNRIDGFSDRAAVAQAVASALVAEAPAGP